MFVRLESRLPRYDPPSSPASWLCAADRLCALKTKCPLSEWLLGLTARIAPSRARASFCGRPSAIAYPEGLIDPECQGSIVAKGDTMRRAARRIRPIAPRRAARSLDRASGTSRT